MNGYVPRGGIFEGDSVIGNAEGYWGPPVRQVQAVPARVPIHQVPNFAHVGVAPYPRSLGSDVWQDPLCAVNKNLPWCDPGVAVRNSVTCRANPMLPGCMSKVEPPAPAPVAPRPRGQRPSALDSIYRAELLGRGHGIFEQSVLACPTAGGYNAARGGIFDGPTIDQQCTYADREQRQIPQAKPPEKPIDTDAAPEAGVAFGYGPDGLGWYRRAR